MPQVDPNTVLLYVEDDALTRLSVGRQFRRHGINVLAAESGEQALEFVEHGARPALVLLDIGLPGIDGVETYRRLRISCSNLPAVVCTAHPAPGIKQRLAELGAPSCRLLTKPCPFAKILEAVKETLAGDGV